MKNWLITLIVIALSGCVNQSYRPPTEARVITTETPVCSGKAQCDAAWIRAQDTLINITGMNIRISTDSRIETFNPITYGRMGGIVSKYPVGNEKYEIRLRLVCYGHTECEDQKASGTNLFNMMVTPYDPPKF